MENLNDNNVNSRIEVKKRNMLYAKPSRLFSLLLGFTTLLCSSELNEQRINRTNVKSCTQLLINFLSKTFSGILEFPSSFIVIGCNASNSEQKIFSKLHFFVKTDLKTPDRFFEVNDCLILSYDQYGPASFFFAKPLMKVPYEGRTRWRKRAGNAVRPCKHCVRPSDG